MFIGPILIYAMKHHTHTHSKMKQKKAYNKKKISHMVSQSYLMDYGSVNIQTLWSLPIFAS